MAVLQHSDLLAQSVGGIALAIVVGLLIGIVGSYLVLHWLGRNRLDIATREAERTRTEARAEAEVIRKAADVEAKAELLKGQQQLQKEADALRNEIKEAERRLAKREDNLESKLDTLNTKERNLEQEQKKVSAQLQQVAAKEEQLDELIARRREDLLQISGMSAAEAKKTVLKELQAELDHEGAELVHRILAAAKEEAAQKSREIILTAIQRFAMEHTAEATVSTVDIPSDDMKGRVIGREGRNIRAFERATGVDVIVDDTPGVVVVSAFDPVRREVARQTLERLIQDGRIHPARIEEVAERVRKEVEEHILETGKKAAIEANVSGLHRKQIDLLGRLKYRTSYGQNVLRHSIEVAFLCQIIADELGLDGRLARRCGLLHDIGKAIDHEGEGSHQKLGADFCRRFNEKPEVLNAIEGHHGDIPSISPYTPIVMAADAISAARPGSRRESLERYVQRLEQLEALAKIDPGVKEAFAIQAGREIRVIVDAKRIDDMTASKLALDIAKKIEAEMTYPGEIKVTVLREMRAVALAK